MNHILKRGLLFVTVLIAGCASAAVTPGKASTPARASRPQQIVVRNFAVVAEDIKESHGTISRAERKFSTTTEEQRQMEIGHQAAQEISDRLAKDLQGLGFTTVEQAGEAPMTGDALLVEGQFINVDQGAAGRRIIIGFGAGKATVDTRVKVYRVSNGTRQRLLEFTTHADSGKLPGSALTMGAGAVATGGASLAGAAVSAGIAGGKAYDSAVSSLANKTADQVNAYLSHYFAEQEWISADKARALGVNIAPKTEESPNRANTL